MNELPDDVKVVDYDPDVDLSDTAEICDLDEDSDEQ